MIEAIRRFDECTKRKPKRQLRHEISLCKKYWGCYPLHYFRYDLYRKDKEITEEELINYIPEFFFYYLFLPFYNSKQYNILLSDKNIMETVFRSAGIIQAPTVLKLTDGCTFTEDFRGMSFIEIKKELANKLYEKIYVKPVSGSGGFGIYVFYRDNHCEYFTSKGEKFNEGFIYKLGKTNDYIVQGGLTQTNELSSIYSRSVNTFRIVTENTNGTVKILGSVLRIGKDGNELDNACQGGMMIKIDSETGKSGSFATTEAGRVYSVHPDTGCSLKDFFIGEWSGIRDFALKSAARLPHFKYLGWDIALTSNGPAAIEANLGFGLDLMQIPMGGMRKVFGIDDSKLYYKNRGKRA
jgi:hypothetical protein